MPRAEIVEQCFESDYEYEQHEGSRPDVLIMGQDEYDALGRAMVESSGLNGLYGCKIVIAPKAVGVIAGKTICTRQALEA